MKQFLIVGSIGAVIYADVFPYIKSRDVKYRPQCIHKFENGVAAATWYTTMETPYIPPLELTKSYNPDDYPTYDNYDAINVDRTMNIPYDYQGVMGVPLTFLDKYCPDQFEIVGCSYSYGDCGVHHENTPWNIFIDGKENYRRIFISHRK